MIRMRPRPYSFQKEGVRLIQHFGGRCLLADDMGLGKTPQALWWSDKYLGPVPIVIICPENLKINWKREAKKFCNIDAEILYHRTPPRRLPVNTDQTYIINYDIIGAVQRPEDWPRLHTWGNLLRKLRPGLVIIDECQYIKSMKAKRTHAVRQLCEGVPHALGLSGGPLVNNPAEMWPILNILRPKKYPVFSDFAFKWCDAKPTRWGWQFTGGKNLPRLNRQLKKIVMVRRRKEDVLTDLPPVINSIIPFALSKEGRAEYEDAESNFLTWLRRKSPKLARRAAKAEALARMGYLKRLAAELKLKYVQAWIDDFLEESNEKLLAFGIHKKILRPLESHFGKLSVRVDGSVVRHARQAAIDRFNTKKDCRLFLGQIDAAGVGWSCRTSSAVGHMELAWTATQHRQATDRARGIGRGIKGRPTNVYWFVAEGTIEEKLCELIQKKAHIVDAVLDGREMVDFALFDELMVQMKAAA